MIDAIGPTMVEFFVFLEMMGNPKQYGKKSFILAVVSYQVWKASWNVSVTPRGYHLNFHLWWSLQMNHQGLQDIKDRIASNSKYMIPKIPASTTKPGTNCHIRTGGDGQGWYWGLGAQFLDCNWKGNDGDHVEEVDVYIHSNMVSLPIWVAGPTGLYCIYSTMHVFCVPNGCFNHQSICWDSALVATKGIDIISRAW